MTTAAVTTSGPSLRRTPRQSQRDFRILLDVLSRPGLIGRLAVTPGVPAVTIPVAGLADVEVPLAVLADADWSRALYLATGAPTAEPERARLVLAPHPPTANEIATLPKGDALHPELGARLVIAVNHLTPLPPNPGNTPASPEPRDGTASPELVDRTASPAPGGVVALSEPEDGTPSPELVDRTASPAPGGVVALPEPGDSTASPEFGGGVDAPAAGDIVLTLRGPGVDGESRVAVGGLPVETVRALVLANADFPAGIDTFLVAPDGAVVGLPRSTRISTGEI